MQIFTITRRTFEAEQYPQDSAKRAELNRTAATSEYGHSHKYHLKGKNFSATYRTKREALEAAARMLNN
jgi:hypothetical protein